MAALRTSVAALRTCCQLLLCIKAPDSRDAKVLPLPRRQLLLKYGARPKEVLPLPRAQCEGRSPWQASSEVRRGVEGRRRRCGGPAAEVATPGTEQWPKVAGEREEGGRR
ncbi:hypothetical protein GUJ93_ZPchr0004g38993 [Zizania palustris]|uniref:Uncharacterized protein n=1 Tax=Zizania palustris TaxID=103762 RepID=A0A8J5VZN2_ZIZPA|nr:hypothetical protein GUJ93_ZPchr0004g38993 [Zizania palustris]